MLFLLSVFAGLSASSDIYGAASDRPKRVLIISTGSRLAPGFALVDQQLFQALAKVSQAQVEIYAENLDLIQFSSERYQKIFREYLSAKYAEYPPDLVILIFVGNLRIPGTLLPQLFPDTPIIAAGLTEEAIQTDQFGPLVSGLAQRINARAALELIPRVQPDLRRLVVVAGTAEIDRQVLHRVKEAAQPFAGRVQIDFWDNLSMAQLRQAVATLPPRSAILFARMFRDGAGQAYVSSRVAQSIAQWANVPVYIMSDAGFGTGAVGGAMASIEAFGKRAGELARMVLSGTDVKSLPFEIRADSVPIFDWRALKRWGISESRLPPDSVVLNRPQSFWQEYRWYIVGALIIIGIQAAMIINLLVQRRRRRRVEAQLRESRQLMELAASAGELGLWSRELTTGKVWANAPMRAIFGFGMEEALGFDDLVGRVHPDDLPHMTTQVLRAQSGGVPFEGEFRIVQPGGAERWVLAKGRVQTDSNRSGNERRMGVIWDITERKRAEEKVRESEQRFRAMANAAPVMIWMAGPDKLCTFFNNGWLDFTGRTLEQELGNGWTEGVHREDYRRCLEVYVDAFEARRAFSMEYRLRRYDGDYRWVMDQGVPRVGSDDAFLGYIGTAIDITDRKRAAEALEKERLFLRQVIDTVPNFIFAKDRAGRFTLANRAVAAAYGTTVENLIGKTDADFNPNGEEVEHFRRMDCDVIDTLQERFIAEEHITDVDGKVRWLQTVKRPIIESDGSAEQLLGASTDITQRKETEAELREQRVELAHVARISIMGELAASLAHELNQPLTAILSNAQAALRFMSHEPVDLEEVREILQDIVADNSRAGEVIRRMRALVKKEQLEFAPLDLASLVRDVVALVHSDAVLQNVRIALELADNLPAVRGDKVQLQQVVLNLLLNAFDAMRDCRPTERAVKLQVDRNGAGLIQTAVSDCGTGLSSDKLEKVFQPFYTTKGEGLGMGLSICRSIVEAHGGHLWAENNPDRGATFYFTVPVSDARC